MIQRTLFYNKAYFYLLLLLAVCLPLSIFATTVILILLAINWLIEGNFPEKWRRLKKDKAFWVFAIFYLIHIVGMIWSEDMNYGMKDLKVKLPLLFLPFLIVTSGSPSIKELKYILLSFIAGNVIASLAVVLALTNIIPVEISEYRNASIFISHIRFSLMIVLSIGFAFYLEFLDKDRVSHGFRYFLLFSLIWLPIFLVILRSLSGIVILIILLFIVAFLLVRSVRSTLGRFMLRAFMIFIPLFAILYTGGSIKKFYTIENLTPADIDSVSFEGNSYVNHLDNREIENGSYVWIHVCPEELEREWAKRSYYEYKGKSDNGSFLRFTLIRYMTSLGLRKDAVGMGQLTDGDIEAVEKGIANHIYLRRFALYPRIYEVIWEIDRYKLGYSPNDKSMVQRLFYLKAGVSIAKENMLMGVGTGDVKQSFDDYYEENNSPLRPERRRRGHNQYLTFFLTFGIIGGILCIFALLIPVFMKKRWGSYMTAILFITMALSMLNEDTLETTTGVVLFSLFYALFTFGPDWPWRQKALLKN